jgi:hypothetical protein
MQLTRRILLGVFIGLLLVSPIATAKGNVWTIKGITPPTGNGTIKLKITIVRFVTPTKAQIRVIPIELGVRKGMTVEEKTRLIAALINAQADLEAPIPSNGGKDGIVKVEVEKASLFDTVSGVEIQEQGPGEKLTGIKDDPVYVFPPMTGYLIIEGEPTPGGVLSLQIGAGPLLTVSTCGRSPDAIAEDLTWRFMQEYAGFPYTIETYGAYVEFGNVPCEAGIAAGTNDPGIDLLFGMLLDPCLFCGPFAVDLADLLDVGAEVED